MIDTPMTRLRATTAPQTGRAQKRQAAWLLLASLPMLVFLLVPLVALLLRIAPAQLLVNLANREIAQAISLSMITTAITVVLTVLVGTPVAYLLARRQFRGRTALDTLIDLPMVLPPSVAGIALLVAFGRRGLLGQYLGVVGIELAFTETAVVLAQLFVAAPFYIKAAAAGFAGVDRDLEQAAALDGASSLIFAGNFIGRTQTMPLAIYQGFEQELNIALTLSVILLAVSFAVLFIVKGVLRQRL
jgi:molybdate transport system permease protein